MGLMRKRRWSGSRQGHRGQSLVELAVALPLMMSLIMGVIDFGWVLYAHVQVAAASYDGARAGALFKGVATDLTADNDTARALAVRKAIYDPDTSRSALGRLSPTSPSFNVDTDVVVTPTGTADTANPQRRGQELVVKVTYHKSVWFGILPGTADRTFDLSTTTKVRIQ